MTCAAAQPDENAVAMDKPGGTLDIGRPSARAGCRSSRLEIADGNGNGLPPRWPVRSLPPSTTALRRTTHIFRG